MKLIKTILIILIATVSIPICTHSINAFEGRDGNETVSCTKLTEPFAILDVASQGGTNYGKYYVQTITGGTNFYLYDIEEDELLQVIPFAVDGSAYKNNNANFGSEFYDTNDLLPLLYVSSAYDYRINVFRIYQENGLWKANCVQKISYPTINNAAGYYSCNAVVDSENNHFYLTPLSYIYTTLENQQHFYKFELPALSEGDVEITINDSIEHISVWDYIHAPQGAIYKDGKIYQLNGVGNAFLRVFDLQQEEYIKTYKLSDFGYNMEPESLGYYNGDFYSMDDSLEVWKISITESDPEPILTGTYKEMNLTQWVRGSINPDTGNETTSTKIARTIYPIKTLDADKLIIETPTHYLGEADGNYYKWRVIWFDGSDCLGLAEEQSDFATFTEFDIPSNADSFRLAIAAVYAGKTQNTFPLNSFLSNGGVSIQLFKQSDNHESMNVSNWELGSFNSNGVNSVKTEIARMTSLMPTLGADELVIDVPVHYTGATTSNSYYKWSVFWYNDNNCLGLATEQNNFDTTTTFIIPVNANNYRIKIASVNNGNTESDFPLSTFISNGGLNIKLYDINKEDIILDEWELGSFSPSSGAENTKTRIARTEECISTENADYLFINPPTHYSGATTNSAYYKWRIVWFNGSTCLGIASEQTDFSTNTQFRIPTNADSFRMTIASVVNGVTEDPFPLNTFINNGGIDITLAGNNLD